jgi:uncharacterized protein YbjT (DUF2867 family)
MSDQNNPIVITGVTGNVGGLVAQGLLKAGRKVRLVARDMYKIRKYKEQDAELVETTFTDSITLTKAFTNAKAAFVLTPLPIHSANLNEEQYRNINGIITAIKNSGIKNIVLLSSWGTELENKSGGILGCRYFEHELKKITGLNVVFLRPVWFMENFIYNVDLIKMAGINGVAINPEVRFPMVDTRDIAAIALKFLLDLNFTGINAQYILGPREYTMKEVTAILGVSIGKPNMKYIEFPQSVLKTGMVGSGTLSANAADMLIEINRAISNGSLKAEARTKHNTSPTTLEEFAVSKFAPAYKAASKAKFKEKLSGFFLRSFLSLAGKHMLKKEKNFTLA